MQQVKVWTLRANEDWICDRFCDEWRDSGAAADTLESADVIWLLSDWMWQHISNIDAISVPIVATVHHIVPSKFDQRALDEFRKRDAFVTAYHVPCKKTHEQLKPILKLIGSENKRIFVQPFWVNGNLWCRVGDEFRTNIRENLKLSGKFVIASFQRDTEGMSSFPKLEKGPDIFCDIVEDISQKRDDIHVLLAGWRRQYVISRLKAANIPFTYMERPQLSNVNLLYNAADCYIVSSRFEGGPQAIVECSAIGVPIVSRDVGVASEILHKDCISDDVSGLVERINIAQNHVQYNRASIEELLMPNGFIPFVDFFSSLSNKRSRFSELSPGIGKRVSDV